MEGNPVWLRQHTRTGKVLLIVLIFVTIIAVGLVVTLGIILSKGYKEADICFTPGCIHASSKVLQLMDPSVDPCDDFYQFACGRFIKEINIPDDKSTVSTSSVITDLVVEQLRSLIEEPVEKNEPKAIALIKKFYKSCMNKTLIEEIGLKDVKQILRKFGGWPVLDGKNWKEKDFRWERLIYKFGSNGIYIDNLITFFIEFDEKNSSRRLINLDQPFLVLPREIVMKGTEELLVKAYYDYMVDVAIIFGADKTIAKKELRDSLQFEMLLSNISVPNEERRDSMALYNPMTIKELQVKYPSIPWLEYINTLLSPHVTVSDEEVVVVNSPTYLAQFEKVMKETPKRVQANYIIWRGIQTAISFLPDELRNRQLQFSTLFTGKTARVPRWRECIDLSTMSLDIAASALYVRKYFKEAARRSVEELVSNIRAELKESLKKVDWMDEKTRQHALEKADTTKTHIGYPTELLDDAKLEEYYQGLEVDDTKYLKSRLNISLFDYKLAYRKLRLPVNKTDWTTHSSATAVNAFYSTSENSIEFPAGILQGVYFNHERPKYMNYGGIGFIIGHEITHGFDDEGRLYDKDGNLVDWWIPDTKKAFKKKAQCIIESYGNYTVPEIGLKLNGINTQGENIADIGGVKQAYLAYDRWVSENGEEPGLPGLDYTGRQLFWISAANIWCSKTRPEVLKQRLYDDEHSPDKYRIWGVVSNLHEFARDFDCPINTKMNPQKKCQLW